MSSPGGGQVRGDPHKAFCALPPYAQRCARPLQVPWSPSLTSAGWKARKGGYEAVQKAGGRLPRRAGSGKAGRLKGGRRGGGDGALAAAPD